jgi:uncharacterized phage protein (TIGR02220 family)
MANWFKIYETDLDEKRLKYALNKLPEVGWVWINILSECCKHRSDTIRYSQNEIDLFGFADAIKVSIPKINAAVSLLCEIEYIEQLEGKIRVIRWNEKQSEYNHRKQRGDYQRVSDKLGESPLEERRGDEKKGDKKHSADAICLLNYLNEKTSRSFRQTDSNMKFIESRLSELGVTVAGVKKMINRQCSRWLGTDQAEYLRPETLFNKTKFDGYYAAKDQPVGLSQGSQSRPTVHRLTDATYDASKD